MRELRAALDAMARSHGVRDPEQIVRRYCGHLVGWPEAAAVRAVREASSRNSRLPRPEQILERLNRRDWQ